MSRRARIGVRAASRRRAASGMVVRAARAATRASRPVVMPNILWSAPVTATTPSGNVAMAYPTNAGMVNVVTAYGVAPNDILSATANTAAINAALTANDWKDVDATHAAFDRRSARTLFLPAGTIWINGPLYAPGSSIRILGAGETHTILKVVDGSAAFSSAGSPEYVLRTGEAGSNDQENAGFSNFIHHLTIDAGANNPGAIGCRYSVANAGSMRHVTIKSSDATKRGVYGLMFGSSAGPGMVADVTIDGFDYGIHSEGNSSNDIVFSRVTLTNQRLKGVNTVAKSLVFEDLTINSPSASAGFIGIDIADATAVVMVDGMSITGPGSGAAVKLISTAYAYLRDVTASGWTNLVTQGATQRFTGRTSLTEWGAVNYRRGNTSVAWGENSGYVGLNLPNEYAPEYHTSDLSKWARPQDYGYNGTTVTLADTIEAAIAAGKEIFYLPYAEWTLDRDVTLQGSLRVFDGMCSALNGPGSLIVGNNSSGHPIIVQNLVPVALTVVHNSANTFVYRDGANRNAYTRDTVSTGSSATGDLFYESAGSNQRCTINRPVNAWLRQVNREQGSHIISGGATVRIFGDNMEIGPGNAEGVVNVTGGSTVEVIGASFDCLDRLGLFATFAAFAAVNSTMSVVTSGYLRGDSNVVTWVTDTEAGSLVGTITDATVYEATTGTSHREVVQMYVSP